MAIQVQFRGGTTAEHSTFTGAAKEVTVDTTKKTLVVHDGSTAGGIPVAKAADTVNLTGAQTVAGVKTFSSDQIVNGATVGRGAGAVANNTAVGASALAGSNSGSGENTAVGSGAFAANTTGSIGVAIGSAALFKNTTGAANTAVGRYAMIENTTGQFNTSVGSSALQNNTTAANNTAVGFQAGFSNTTGIQNTFVGRAAGYTTTVSEDCTYIGDRAGQVATGDQNLCVGAAAGLSLTTGSGNTFVGRGVGTAAGVSMTTGSKNVILGGYGGNQGGLDIRTASNHIVLSDGDGNPRGIFDASGNLLVGATSVPSVNNARVGFSGIYTSDSNSTALADQRTTLVLRQDAGSGSNNQGAYSCLVLSANQGLSDNPGVMLRGYGGSGGSTYNIQINGNGNITNANNSYGSLSDESLKENIVDATPKLNDLMAVQVRGYNLKNDEKKTKQLGVIAQELETVFPTMVDVEPDGLKSVKYSVFVPMLIKAIQELKAEFDAYKATHP